MFFIIKKGASLQDIDIVLDTHYSISNSTPDEYPVLECLNEEDLFFKLLNMFPRHPYWEIAELIRSFGVKVSNDYLVKSYCSKCNRLKYYKGEDLYLILDYKKELKKADLVYICTKYEYFNMKNIDTLVSVKVKKEILPFYLSFLLKKFTAKDFYFCFKNITGIKDVPTVYSNSPEFFIVKNKSKIISYHTSYDLAMKTIKIMENLQGDDTDFLKPKVFEVKGYEALLDFIDNSKIQKSSNFEKYMIDYDWYFDYCLSKKYIDISNLDIKSDVFLIRNKNNETVIKDNEVDMYNYIKENKLYSEDIFFFKNHDIDYNCVINCFEKLKDELCCDNALINYLNNVNYIEKIKILENLVDIVNDTSQQNDICYSFSKSVTNEFELTFFRDEFSFHKQITSLDYGIDCLSCGRLSLKTLRKFLMHTPTSAYNAKISRTDISFNISSLFKQKKTSSSLLKSLKDMDAVLDVDAYLKHKKSACGVVVRNSNNEIIAKISKKLDATTSVEAEIKGAIFAIDYITKLEPNLKNICIRYDCFSVADYLISEPSSQMGEDYQNFIKQIVKKYPDLNIYMKKVRGHSADFFNDIADSLAGNFFD